jgi:nucleotide-binding universal stress UspA family protein
MPLDGSQRAESVLSIGSTLAQAHQAKILVVHVVRQPEMPRRTPPTQEEMSLAAQITEKNQDEAERYLSDIQRRLGGDVETRLVVSNSVSAALHSIVEQEEIELVLLSAHGYTGDTSWPYGSTVISFIAYGVTPLIVIQDLPADRIERSPAEIAAQQQGRR